MALILFISLITPIVFASQTQDSLQTQRVLPNKRQIGGFPVIFYSDETRFAGGGGAQVMFSGESERFSSTLGLMSFLTQNKQYMFIIAPEIFLKNDTYKIKLKRIWKISKTDITFGI